MANLMEKLLRAKTPEEADDIARQIGRKERTIFEEEPVKDRRGEQEEMGGRGSAVEIATRRGSKRSGCVRRCFRRADSRADGEDDEGD